MPKPNDKIGPYTLLSKLGRGSFGAVWLAEKRTLFTTIKVAIKLSHEEDIDLEAIQHEASLWSEVSGHPNVLPIIDADIFDEQVAIISEYASGGSLNKWLQKHGGKAPSIQAAVRMMDGILAGLEHLHSKSIIHRDLKPDNILLQNEIPRLADFGISRILKTTNPKYTTVSGTLPYMGPETFRGKRSEQTDIWSAGIIFYELLMGCWPFQGDQPTMMHEILTKELPPLSSTTPESLKRIIAKTLQKDEKLRYKSASEMRKELNFAVTTSIPLGEINTETQTLPAIHTEGTLVPKSLLPTLFPGAREFIGDDDSYLQWIREHPNGFVVNTAKSMNPNYMVLHRASCPHIRELEPQLQGGFTERGYIKICSQEVESLKEWVKQHGRNDGSFSGVCNTCKPLLVTDLSPTQQLQIEYWRALHNYLQKNNSIVKLKETCPEYSSTGFLIHPQVELVATANANDSRISVGVWIYGRQDIFRALEREKEAIEREIAWHDPNKRQDFLWLESKPDKTINDVWLRWHDTNIKRRGHWQEYLEWHRTNLESFYRVFEPRVRNFEVVTPERNVTWHNFEAGKSYSRDDVVSLCLEHIVSGKVDDPDEKLQLLETIQDCGHSELVFTPQGTGWGASPLNPNNWRTPDGHSISGKMDRAVNSTDVANIDEPVVAININQQFPHVRSAEDLYNSTRSMWRVNRQRADRAKYAFSVYQGIIREVYEIDRWMPASPTTRDYWDEREQSQGRDYPPEVHEGRSEFIGKLAPEHIRKKYVGKRMPVKHSQNPIRYINC